MVTRATASTQESSRVATARDDLREHGFAIVHDVVSRESLKAFRDVLMEIEARCAPEASPVENPFVRRILSDADGAMRPDQVEILYPSVADPRLRDSELYAMCAELADAIRPGYTMSFDTAFIKLPRNRSFILWHRDSDHSPLRPLGPRFLQRLQFWVPLQDTTEANGCLQYIAGSHREPRLLTAQDSRRIACAIPAGSLTIHTAQTLHASGGNMTDEARASCTLTFGRWGSHKRRLYRMLGRMPA